MKITTTSIALAIAALLITAGASQAQKTDPLSTQPRSTRPADSVDQLLAQSNAPAAAVNDGEAYRRAEDAQQDPGELHTTQALNDEIASRNQLAENQERADQEAFELERARYQATVDQGTRDRLAYEEAVRQSDAAQRQWEIDRDRAEQARGQYAADILACRAGDRRRCAANPAPK